MHDVDDIASLIPDTMPEFSVSYIGLLGFRDPVRPGVTESLVYIQQCLDAVLSVFHVFAHSCLLFSASPIRPACVSA